MIRTVFFDFSKEQQAPPYQFGGYEHEHNATELKVKLPAAFTSSNISYVNFDFQTSLGETVISGKIRPVTNTVSIDLVQQLTCAGTLLFQVVGRTNDDTVVAKTAVGRLTIEKSPYGDPVELNEDHYRVDDEIKATLKEAQELVDSISTRLGTVYQKLLENELWFVPFEDSPGYSCHWIIDPNADYYTADGDINGLSIGNYIVQLSEVSDSMYAVSFKPSLSFTVPTEQWSSMGDSFTMYKRTDKVDTTVADGAVTTEKLADAAVTLPKLGTDVKEALSAAIKREIVDFLPPINGTVIGGRTEPFTSRNIPGKDLVSTNWFKLESTVDLTPVTSSKLIQMTVTLNREDGQTGSYHNGEIRLRNVNDDGNKVSYSLNNQNWHDGENHITAKLSSFTPPSSPAWSHINEVTVFTYANDSTASYTITVSDLRIVDSSIQTDIEPNTIYMVKSSRPQEDNVYDEYMFIHEDWEQIGSTAMDLSRYYTKEEVDVRDAESLKRLVVAGLPKPGVAWPASGILTGESFSYTARLAQPIRPGQLSITMPLHCYWTTDTLDGSQVSDDYLAMYITLTAMDGTSCVYASPNGESSISMSLSEFDGDVQRVLDGLSEINISFKKHGYYHTGDELITVVTEAAIGDVLEENTLYMVPCANPADDNRYDEYLYIDGAMERIGSTAVDLSGYYTKAETDSRIEGNWRKIADMTLEEAAVVNITADMDNQPFALKRFTITVTKPGVEGDTASGYLWLKTNYNKAPKPVVQSNTHSGTLGVKYRICGEMAARWETDISSSGAQEPSDNTTAAVYRYPLGTRPEIYALGREPITNFILSWGYSDALPVGTSIEIWGMNA